MGLTHLQIIVLPKFLQSLIHTPLLIELLQQLLNISLPLPPGTTSPLTAALHRLPYNHTLLLDPPRRSRRRGPLVLHSRHYSAPPRPLVPATQRHRAAIETLANIS